jgi:hypothetical protein
MTTVSSVNSSKSFKIIGILALIWNLIGVAFFSLEILMSEAALSEMKEAERQLIENTPAWAYFLYGVAVFAGTLGSVLLLLKKASSVLVFLVSFLSIVIQMSRWIFLTPVLDVYGPSGAIMPVTVIVIGALLLWYSKRCKAAGILA